jgi:hypothetical protein
MLTIETVDTQNKSQVRRFMNIPFPIYAENPNWVPPLFVDVEVKLNRQKHPFYEHSQAEFYMAVRDGRDVGRIAVLENTRFNQHHHTRKAQFYLFECENNQETANLLFERAFEWARRRGLDTIIGPKGFGVLDGYGIQVEGFEHRQMMMMMNYNPPYYPRLLENLGFEKEVDFVSCHVAAEEFELPERIQRIADRVLQKGRLGVQYFKSQGDLKAWAKRIGRLYNNSFVNNWEYYPLTEREIDFVLQDLLTVADPRLIKIITHQEDAVGFIFGFPDVSAALQRARGRLLPFGIIDIMLEIRRTDWISFNGAGVLPEFQGTGGNAVLYSEMVKTIRDNRYHFLHADLTQVAETAVQMRRDLVNLGGKMYKNHRVYRRAL